MFSLLNPFSLSLPFPNPVPLLLPKTHNSPFPSSPSQTLTLPPLTPRHPFSPTPLPPPQPPPPRFSPAPPPPSSPSSPVPFPPSSPPFPPSDTGYPPTPAPPTFPWPPTANSLLPLAFLFLFISFTASQIPNLSHSPSPIVPPSLPEPRLILPTAAAAALSPPCLTSTGATTTTASSPQSRNSAAQPAHPSTDTNSPSTRGSPARGYPLRTACSNETMSTKDQQVEPMPELVTLDHAFKLAEQWVKNVSGDWHDEETELKLEGRPPGLGLGAIVPRKSNLVPINDPAGRKLKSMLKADARKREAADAEFCRQPVKDSDDDDDEGESRTKVFAKRRDPPLSLTAVTSTGKKKKTK